MENIINNYDKNTLNIGIVVGLFVLLILLYFVINYNKETKKLRNTLKEKEEKIMWFRQLEAENERKRVALAHKVELETQSLQNKIESLKKEAKEGTKNQVIAKLESQQNKREKLLKRAGLSHTEA